MEPVEELAERMAAERLDPALHVVTRVTSVSATLGGRVERVNEMQPLPRDWSGLTRRWSAGHETSKILNERQPEWEFESIEPRDHMRARVGHQLEKLMGRTNIGNRETPGPVS